ncbi:hypothetical protein D3C71_1136480 [compost metagenome]
MRISELHEQFLELELVAKKDAPLFRKIRRSLVENDSQVFSNLLREITDWSMSNELFRPTSQRILIVTNARRSAPELEVAKHGLLEMGYQSVVATLGVRGRRKDVGLPGCDAMLLILTHDSEAIFDPVLEHAMQMLALAHKKELPIVTLVENTTGTRFGLALENTFQSLAQTIPIMTYWSERDFERVMRDALRRLRKALRDRTSGSPIYVPSIPSPRRLATLPTYPTPPLPAPISNPMDLQSGRWGKRASRLGRKLLSHLIEVGQNEFTFDLVVRSVDGTDLEGPVIFHLHDTYARKTIHIRKIREGGKIAILEKTTAYGVYTVGVQVMAAKGGWTSLELDLRTLAEQDLPRRFLRR